MKIESGDTMLKTITHFFLPCFLLAWGIFNSSLAFAAENIEYRFERLWPRLEQPWYFSEPADIAIGSDASVYILDTSNNRIQQFSAEGDLILIWGSEGAENGQFDLPQGLDISTDGSVYIVDTDNHRIQRFSAQGGFIQTWGSEGSEDGQFDFPSDIAIAPDGSVYIADSDNHRIQQFSAAGEFIRTWGSEGSSDGQFNFPGGLAIAPDGNVYIADSDNHRIQQFSAEGDFIRTWGNEGAENGQFDFPKGLAIALDGSVYVADVFNDRIQQFSTKGDFIRTWGSEGTGDGQFGLPQGLAVAPDGSVYIADTNNDRIQQFSAKGDFSQAWGSSGSEDGQFDYPTGLAITPDGSVTIADTYNYRIQQFNSEGKFLQEWGNQGSEDGQFDIPEDLAIAPNGLTIAPNGSIYIADSGNDRIQQFSAKGDFIRAWGDEGSEDGQFDSPTGLAIAPDGSVTVADTYNHRIQKFSAQGDFIQTWGSEGSEEGQFDSPQGIAIAADGSVYIADTNNSRIQQFSVNGDFIRTWGNEGSEDGQFDSPTGLAIAPDGSVTVADTYNHRIQQFSAQGDFIQSWGSEGSGDGQFFSPSGIGIAPDGSAYITDSGNHRIQKFVPRNKAITTHPYKAIILAGGGETIGGRTNHIWDGTWRITQKAYKALSRQAFIIHDEIKFLTAGSTLFDLDRNNKFDDLEAASKDSLRLAITEWATDAKDVVIFLANHGGPKKFQVNDSEILTGEELNSWVSQLDNSIPGTVTVIIEACNSASFFEQLSKSERNLFASTKADQPAVISNQGLSSFSYFLWSEIGTGAHLQEAFRAARQGMSSIIIDGAPQNAQADTDGDQKFTQQDLELLGDYCLGNCNQTAAAAPVIAPISPNARTLKGETALDFSVKVNHLQALNRAWVLVQRPDDISIDPNQALNFEKIKLSCNSQDICQGRYEHFDLAGEYRLSFYAMDVQEEVSLPEILSITQTQGKTVIPALYDDQLAVVYLRDVLVGEQHLQVALELQGDKFVAIAVSAAPKQYAPAAKFDFESGILNIPHALVFGKNYQATFKYLGNLEFKLESATPK